MERQNTSGSAHSSFTFPSLAPLLCSNFLSGHMQEMSLPQEMPDIPPQTSKVFAQLIQPIALNNTLSIDLCHQHVNIPPTSPPPKKILPFTTHASSSCSISLPPLHSQALPKCCLHMLLPVPHLPFPSQTPSSLVPTPPSLH